MSSLQSSTLFQQIPQAHTSQSSTLQLSTMATTLPSTKSIMDILPVELIHMICAQLSTPSLSAFRLTNRLIGQIGERYIVSDLHLMFTHKSFQNLLFVSQSPSLRRWVHSITYEVRYLEELERSDFETNILDSDEVLHTLILPRTDADQGILLKAWEAYKPMLDQQMHMKRANYDFAVLGQALPRFPILRKIEMSSEYGMPSDAMARAYAATAAIPGLMLDAGDISDEDDTGSRALGSLLLAAMNLPSPLESLVAHRVHWSFFNPAPLSLHFGAFTYLKHIDLFLEPDYDDWLEKDVVRSRHAELGKALRAARGLETLRLCFDDEDSVPKTVLAQRSINVPVLWEHITQDTTWPCLHTLELTIVTSSEPDMTAFLKRHASTLRVLKWRNMWLADTAFGWNRVFKKMKKYMGLTKVEFGGVWGGDSQGKPKLLSMEGDVGAKVARSILRGHRSERVERDKEKEVAASRARMSSREIQGMLTLMKSDMEESVGVDVI